MTHTLPFQQGTPFLFFSLAATALFVGFLPGSPVPANPYTVRLLVVFLLLVPLRSQHLIRDGSEHLLNVDVLFGRRLEELDAHLVGEASGVCGIDDLSRGVVVFVPDKYSVHNVTVLLNFVEPSERER